jgi:O-antigen/teichoic acid export membrane protein
VRRPFAGPGIVSRAPAHRPAATDLPILRYMLALIGPIGSAGAQFLLSLILLRVLDPAAFGRFSFLLVTSQFAAGTWSALFCAPLPTLLTRDEDGRDAAANTLLTASLAGTGGIFLVFLPLGLAIGEGFAGAFIFALYAAISLLRWYARAHAYAHARQSRSAASDISYSVVLLAGSGAMVASGHISLAVAAAILLAGALIGVLPFGREFLVAHLVRFGRAELAGYRPIWRELARWALLGVITTEATANAHVYLVTLVLGPTAFAPIAASALMTRPVTVAMNALTEYERAHMARQIGEQRIADALSAARRFRLVLIAVWVATALAILALAFCADHILFPPRYDRTTLEIGLALWMAVSLIRLGRMPESVLLQAAGAFRPLALASGWSSVLSVVAVAALLPFGALWSILGILAGEALFAASIWRERQRWLRG